VPGPTGSAVRPLLFSLLAGLSTALGGSVIFVLPDPSSKLMALVLALAAGVMSSVSLLELNSAVFDLDFYAPLVWSCVGAVCYYGLSRCIPNDAGHGGVGVSAASTAGGNGGAIGSKSSSADAGHSALGADTCASSTGSPTIDLEGPDTLLQRPIRKREVRPRFVESLLQSLPVAWLPLRALVPTHPIPRHPLAPHTHPTPPLSTRAARNSAEQLLRIRPSPWILAAAPLPHPPTTQRHTTRSFCGPGSFGSVC